MMRALRLLPIFLFVSLSFSVTSPIYEDVYLTETDSLLRFGNQRMVILIGKQTGDWRAWTPDELKRGADSSLIRPADQPTLDVSVNGTYLVAKHGATYLRRAFWVDKNRRGASLAVTVGIVAGKAGTYAYELTSIYTLFPLENRLERTARLLRTGADGGTTREHFDGFRFDVPNATIGQPAGCSVTVPGPFWANTLVRAGTPYDSLKNRTINFHSAPDAGFGLLLLGNPKRRLALASFMSTGGEVAYSTSLVGNGQTLTLRHDDRRAYYLSPGQSVESDGQHLVLAPTVAQAMSAYQREMTTQLPLNTQTPAWVKDQVILEVLPKYFKGGMNELRAKLPFYKRVGFTMIYLNPHWVGGYSPIDLYAVDPKFGTADELRALVKTAHELGLKVIFDMVIHGFNERSAVPAQRPDLFVRNEAGQLAKHPTWGSITTDWASPAYRQYMVDLVLYDQREYDNDGYRVDAATYKGAGWNPNLPYPAYRDGSAAPELMRAMLTALRQKKPGAVLLSEVFGPVFYTVCNFVHDNQTEAVPTLLRRMQAGTYTAEDYKRHLANVFGSLPPGANRVFYARNHDTSWFDKFDGYTPRFMAFETVHALFGIPEVFAGDPDYPFNPDDQPTVFAQYERLFTLRRSRPEFTRGAVSFDAVRSSNPQVFSGLRTLGSQRSLVLVSFSDQPETATITLDGPPARTLQLTDVQTGQPLKLTPATTSTFTLTLKPFQAATGRL